MAMEALANREDIDAEHVHAPGLGDRPGPDGPDQHIAAVQHRQPRRLAAGQRMLARSTDGLAERSR